MQIFSKLSGLVQTTGSGNLWLAMSDSGLPGVPILVPSTSLFLFLVSQSSESLAIQRLVGLSALAISGLQGDTKPLSQSMD